MKTIIVSAKGEKKSEVDLPSQFSEAYEPVIIQRAFNANMSMNYMHKGLDPIAGMKKSVRLSKRRRKFRTGYGTGISRTPRKAVSRRGTRFNFVGTLAPNTRSGRVAHPPLVEKIFEEKINKKERLLALRSAIAATMNKELVDKRGHKYSSKQLPIIVDGIEKLSKTKDVLKMLDSVGVAIDVVRASEKRIRAGKGKRRGRKYSFKKGPLIVVSTPCPLVKSARDLAGVETIPVNHLNVTMLAPGGAAGRLTVWTKEAIEILSTKKLFTGEKA